MIFREADVNNINAAVQLRMAYLNEHFGELDEASEKKIMSQLPDYFKSNIGKSIRVFIAEESGEAVSSVFLLIAEKPANPHFITGRTGSLLNVYTKPEFRRKGIAGKLVDMAIECARNEKLSYIELSATEAGAPLYKEKGFVVNEDKSCLPMKYNLI